MPFFKPVAGRAAFDTLQPRLQLPGVPRVNLVWSTDEAHRRKTGAAKKFQPRPSGDGLTATQGLARGVFVDCLRIVFGS